MNNKTGEHLGAVTSDNYGNQWERSKSADGSSEKESQRDRFQQRFYECGDQNAKEILGLPDDATNISMSLEQRSFISMLSPKDAVRLGDNLAITQQSSWGKVSVYGLVGVDGKYIYPFDHRLQNTVHQAACRELTSQVSNITELVERLQANNNLFAQQYIKSRNAAYITKYNEKVEDYHRWVVSQFRGSQSHADMMDAPSLRRAIYEQVVSEEKMSPEEIQAYEGFSAKKEDLVHQLSQSIRRSDESDSSNESRVRRRPFEMVGDKMTNVEKRIALISKMQYLSRERDDEAMQQVIADRVSKANLPKGSDEKEYLRRALVDIEELLARGNKRVHDSDASIAKADELNGQSDNSKADGTSTGKTKEALLTDEQRDCLAQFVQLCTDYYGNLMPKLEEASFFYGESDDRYARLKVEEKFGSAAQRRQDGREFAEENCLDELKEIKLGIAQALDSSVTVNNWLDTYILPTGVLVWTNHSQRFKVHGESALSDLYHAQMPSEEAWAVWQRLWLSHSGQGQYGAVTRLAINNVVRRDVDANIDNLKLADFDTYDFLVKSNLEVNDLLDESGNFTGQPTSDNIEFLKAVMPYAGDFVRRVSVVSRSVLTAGEVLEHLDKLHAFLKGRLLYYRQPANKLFYPIHDQQHVVGDHGVNALGLRVAELSFEDFIGSEPAKEANRSALSEMVVDDLGMAIFDQLNFKQLTRFSRLLHLSDEINVPVYDITRGYGYSHDSSNSLGYASLNKHDRWIETQARLRPYFINELKKYFKGQVNGEVAAFMDSLKTRK